MKHCYINSAVCISAQKTFGTPFMQDIVINNLHNVLPAIQPDLKGFITPAAGRRMASGVKNSIVAATAALKDAGDVMPDAIITGSGMGCNIDSQKFLQALIDNNEEFLTPTSFIQSTHNTPAAQIALGLQSKVYNVTYVNGAVSFESALIDAGLRMEEGEAASVLVGGVEELAENRTRLLELSGEIKDKEGAPFTIPGSSSTGAVFSEGAAFFVLSSAKAPQSMAKIHDVAIYNHLENDEVEEEIKKFLAANGLAVKDIDAVVLGYNGDCLYDSYYYTVAAAIFSEKPQLYYKHMSGEYNTASAFGLWAAANIVHTQHLPQIMRANERESNAYNNLLLYNQYRGKDHSLTLISKP